MIDSSLILMQRQMPQSQCVLRGMLLSLMAMVTVSGCRGSVEDTRGVRVPVSGTVTLDGTPLEAGRIILETNQGEGTIKATATVKNGTFSFTEENGPLAGTALVKIYAETLELEELEAIRGENTTMKVSMEVIPIPARYNEYSKMTAEIQPDSEEYPLEFALSSR